jgi:TRAP-type C4-dicarboxylate transport system substrate-binding protein
MRIMVRAAMCPRRQPHSVAYMKLSLAALLVACLLAGCSLGGEGDSDKAGGSETPVVLSLAYSYKSGDAQPDESALRYFASRVAERSDGGLRVRITFDAVGDEVPETEPRVANMVRSGQFDLGWVASRVWDLQGVRSFQALQAPFLITDYDLLGRVVRSPLAGEMLDGLDRLGLSGLALVPESLRHPASQHAALRSVKDFDGARFRDIPSAATDSLVSALGATPVRITNARFGPEVSAGNVDSTETAISRARGGWTLTANVIFFGKANTVFANSKAFDKLSREHRDVLRKAARDTIGRGLEDAPSDVTAARKFCAAGRIVNASPAELEGLRRAAQPVYERLERDDLTRSLIARIRAMKDSGGDADAPAPAPCGRAATPEGETVTVRSPEAFNGTYRWQLTKAGALRAGVGAKDPDIGSVVTMTLLDGRWLLGKDPHYSGTFEVEGDRLVFDWPTEASVLTFTFKRGGGGMLDVKPVLPMDRGDQFVWASSPWQRVGPPVRDVP